MADAHTKDHAVVWLNFFYAILLYFIMALVSP